jgi:hypothetical protein
LTGTIGATWTRAAGVAAGALWLALGVRWFDVAAGWRPAWLERVPPIALAAAALVLVGIALAAGKREAAGPPPGGVRGGLLLVVGLAVLFRLPLAGQGAAGYVTPDGALSGIVALHLRDGTEHLVFVPRVPYSGSLKSHLVAPLAAIIDPARAFAVVSVAFYGAFVAALYALALLAGASGWSAVAAGVYAAFAPAFVTRYSLSNDGNYVEVVALGTWALVLAARWRRADRAAPPRGLAVGLLLGLAFWCHILAVIHAAAIAVWALAVAPRRALRAAPAAALGFVLGDWPGLLWNAAHQGESFQYLLPGRVGGGPPGAGHGLAARAGGLIADHARVLLGYDPGYPTLADLALKALAVLAVGVAAVAVVAAAREAWRRRSAELGLLLVFTAVNVLVALLALPLIEGNPRYLLFLMAPLPILIARLLDAPRRRWLMALLVAFGAAGSLAQVPGAVRADTQWRGFVADLEATGVRWCETDFHLATKINFLSQERVVCSSKLGPSMTEYFDYRRQVEAAPEAALIAVNTTAAEKLERRLERLGVAYERRDLMKPVLFRLSRKVEPEELFPGRESPPP